jgi:hypothetical protein
MRQYMSFIGKIMDGFLLKLDLEKADDKVK